MQLLHRKFQRTSHAANSGLMPRGSFRQLCSHLFNTGTICAGTSDSSSDSSSTLLTADTLELSLQAVQGAKLLQTQLQPVPTDAIAIKTMVLVQDSPAAESLELERAEHTALAAGPAVAVLLLAGHKVDLRAVAQHLELPRGSLRLATADEAVASTGYELGCIPPIGHRHQLRTLVDEHILQHTPDQLLCAGGGTADVQLLLEVEQLLAATAGEAGSFSTSKMQAVKTASRTEAFQQQQEQQLLQQQQMLDQATFLHLPLPWADGDECVELVGVLAQRRRIAKLLLFATLVPETVPALPSTGTAAYMRRLWRHPSTGMPCEVQLIMGKTLERRLGREGAAALFDKLKVGAVVALSGKVQQHPQQQPGGSTALHHVLDVVVSDIRMLHKNRDTLARAIISAQRQGHTSITSALQLDQLLAGQAASSTAGMPPSADLASTPAPASQRPAAAAASPAAASGVAAKASAARGVTVTGPGSQTAQQDTASAAGQQQEQQFYNFPLPLSQVDFVQDLEGVLHMHQAILGQVLQQEQPPAPSSSSSSATPVVGLDAEWQPYERGQPRAPVALLQLATRQEVFVIDLLAICRQLGPQSPSTDRTSSSDGSNSTTTDGHLTEQSSQSEQEDPSATSSLQCSRSSMQVSQDDDVSSAGFCQEPPPPAEMALCEFLQQLFSTASIKVVGFQLLGDLQPLAQSYPWLLPSRAAAASAAADGLVASSSSTASRHNSSPSGSRWPSDGAQTLWVAADNTLVWPAASAAAPGIPGDCDGWVVRQAVDLQRLNKLVDPHSRQGSLSALVNRTLGKPLDKAQQASDWAARPLTEEQLVYAANDAHVLTALYDKLAAKL